MRLPQPIRFMHFRLPVLLLLAALGASRASDATQPIAASAGVVFEEVAAFEEPPHYPLNRLVYVPADGNFYGVASSGGSQGNGAIFRLTPAGESTTLVSFTGDGGAAKGAVPDGGLVLGADGALYGTTTAGGAGNYGTIFKVTTGGMFTTLVQFTDTNGSVPGELVLAGDGNFYGTTQGGGTGGYGTVFKMTPAGALTTLVHFTDTASPSKGAVPVGPLVVVGSTIYGVTQMGGALSLGTVFKVATNGASFTTLVEFTGIGGSKPGSLPAAGLCLHSDGALYGTTEYGGSSGTDDFGLVFKVSTGGVFAVLKYFASTDGENPAGTLIEGGDSALYGTTSGGGANSQGTIFKITTAGAHTLLGSFTGTSGVRTGSTPRAGLIAIPGGDFAGTTSAGGIGGFGTCFKVTGAGTFANLLHFTNEPGWEPGGGVAFDEAGDLLVPLREGGAQAGGTLRRVQPGGATSIDATFNSSLGSVPHGGLLRVGGDFFGVATAGGQYGRGTLFKHTPGVGTEVLASPSNSTTGSPQGPPVLGADGWFYVAARGSLGNRGSILRFDATGTAAVVTTFNSSTGAKPLGPLALGEDGNLYGVTESGGTSGRGTAFMVTPGGVLTTLVNFAASPQPNTPLGGLVAGPDGNFYGTTSEGGTGGYGTAFRLTPAGVLTVLANFTDSSGATRGSMAIGPLLAALDGTLYGTTSEGGGDGKGTIFRISPAGTFTTLVEFAGSYSSAPGDKAEGGLVFGPDGFVYGTTPKSGTAGGGNVFRLKQLGPHAGTDAPAFAPGAVIFNGRAQTGGEVTSVSFDYGTSPALGLSTSAANATAANSPASFSAEISGLTPGTTIYYRARAVNPSGTSSGLVRSFVVPEPLAAWNLATFGDANVSALDDNDTDGALNLTEYALLTSAAEADRATHPGPAVQIYPEGRRLSITLQRDPARNDITIKVQAASDPSGPWSALATSTLGAPFSGPGYVSGDSASPGIKTVEIRDVVNLGDAPSRYLRVQITH